MAKSKFHFERHLLVILMFSAQVLAAQLYYQAPGLNALAPVSAQNLLVLKGGQNLDEKILKAYAKEVAKRQIAVQDSVFISLKTDANGKVSEILKRSGWVKANLDFLEEQVEKVQFKEAGIHHIALVISAQMPKAYSVWDVDYVPMHSACERANAEGNDIFTRSCFNYIAEQRLRNLKQPAPKKVDELKGRIKARIYISPQGLVSHIKFDACSMNPTANNFFIYQLYFIFFPKGVKQNESLVSYYLDYDGGFFLEEEENSNTKDTSFAFNVTYLKYDHKIATSTLLQRDSLSPEAVKNFGLSEYQIGDDKLLIYDQSSQVIIGPALLCAISQPGHLLVSPAAVLTPKYFDESNKGAYPACFESCSMYPSALYASTCTSQKMLDHIQKNFGYLRVVETFPGKTCKQVLIIDKDGNLKRQQIIAGDFNAHFDILNLAALSTLPQFTPATLKGKAVPTQIMVYTKLF
jgi:hypothetical protein